MTADCVCGVQLAMEISLKNGDCVLETGVPSEEEDSREVREQRKPRPPRPPLTEFKCPSPTTSPGIWSSPPLFNRKNSEDHSEPNVLLFRKLPDTDHLGTSKRKAFLRPTEHILATFYGIIFVIHGNDWNVLKSEYLPIYFVRVSVKNIKYPFRILVVDNDTERTVDFIVNCNTKTSIIEQAVWWEDQETFGAKFSTKSQAVQFYDTISRMISTLKKGEKLKKENSDKMLELEVHLPGSQIKNYQFLRDDKLEDALNLICGKEHLRANDHYLNYMQLTDDSLDMALRVGDIRTNVVRVVSKKDMRRSSTDVLEKVSQSSAKKNGGIFSLFRRRFARKRKNSKVYSSAPSVLQYTDNIFMVERQAEEQKKDENELGNNGHSIQIATSQSTKSTSNSRTTQVNVKGRNELSVTATPGRSVKRKAPQPPSPVNSKEEIPEIPSSEQGNSVNVGQVTEKKKSVKRRAPSPPKHLPKQEHTLEQIGDVLDQTYQKVEVSKGKPPRPPKPPSLTPPSSNPTSPSDVEHVSHMNQTSSITEKKLAYLTPPSSNPTSPSDVEHVSHMNQTSSISEKKIAYLTPPSSNPTSPSDLESVSDLNQAPSVTEKKIGLPIFIPPPPPLTTPPPLEECETPVGPVDVELGEDTVSVKSSGEINELASEAKSLDSRNTDTSEDQENLEPRNIENTGKVPSAEEVQLPSDERNLAKDTSIEALSESTVQNEDTNKVEDKEEIEDDKTNEVIEVKSQAKETDENEDDSPEPMETSREVVDQTEENETKKHDKKEDLLDDDIKFQENIKNLSPENLQMLLNAQASVGNQTQQLPFNIQNQQFFAMHQRQQILYNLLLQQMLEQQMTQQTATPVLQMNMQAVGGALPLIQNVNGGLPIVQSVVGPVPTLRNVSSAVPTMQPFDGTFPPMQSVGGAAPPVQTVADPTPPVKSVGGAISPTQHLGGSTSYKDSVDGDISILTAIQGQAVGQTVTNFASTTSQRQVNVNTMPETIKSTETPRDFTTVDASHPRPLKSEATKIDETSESSMEEKFHESSELPTSRAPPVKDEELVNRPLFKKMLAQISQGKIKGIPKAANTEKSGTLVGVTPLESPSGKVEKIPSSYVDSAEKKLPPTTVEEIKKPSVSQRGKKSSYVDSVIGRNKVDVSTAASVKNTENISVLTKAEENFSYSGIKSSYVDSASDQHNVETLVSTDGKTVEKIPSSSKEEEEGEKKISVVLNCNGGHSVDVDNTADQHKSKSLATKPKYQRHMSEPAYGTKPKPAIGPKPTAHAIGKSKSLPKSNKKEPLQISLSLTPEERLMLPSFSGMIVTSSVQNKRNVGQTEQETVESVASVKNVKERFERTVNDSTATIHKEKEVHVSKNGGND